MSGSDDARRVLAAYESKFNRLPDQPHYLIVFSKSRSDLPNISYQTAKEIINALNNKGKRVHSHASKSKSVPYLANLASVLPLPNSPQRSRALTHATTIYEDEEEGVEMIDHEGSQSISDEEEEDSDEDELYRDGHKTTPFIQDLDSSSTQIYHDQDEENISSKNKHHPNHIMNPLQNTPSLNDWCFKHGLKDIYDKLYAAGYTTCKMLSKCRDEHIEKISRELQFTTRQELSFKVAVDELRMQYLDSDFHLRHPEEHRSLIDIVAKIHASEKLMTTFYDKLQNINTEMYTYQMDIEREFDLIMEQLNNRRHILVNELNNFYIKKKNIIHMKQETLNQFITETKVKKNAIITMLHNSDVDIHKMEERKKKIMDMHDTVIMDYVNVKKAQYSGCPTVNTSFAKTAYLLKEITQFGRVQENTKNTLGVMPVITSINNSGKDTKIKIKWEITNDHYGLDPDTVKSIKLEWIEIDDDFKNDIDEDETKELKVTLNRWMSKHIRLSLYKAVQHEHEIDVRVHGKFLVRVKLLGAEHALASSYVTSNVSAIKVHKKCIYYIQDKWNSKSKHSDLRIALVNKKTITRNIPGKWRNCLGSTVVHNGLNIWRLLLKKMDTNRKSFSCMIGILDVTKPCYIDVNFTEIGGYGMNMNNGNVFHNKKIGEKYYEMSKKGLRAIKNGDIISVIVDYYRGILSFKINEYDCGPAWFNINTSVGHRLCISMRGCDEIKLLDTENNHGNIIKKHMFLKGNKHKSNAQDMDLKLDICEVQSIDTKKPRFMGSKTPQAKQSKLKYAISAKHIRQKSQSLLGLIRRHSANTVQIEHDLHGLKDANIEKNRMRSKKSKHKTSLSFFKYSKKDKEIDKFEQQKIHNLKTLTDESDEEQSLSLDISRIIASEEMTHNPMYYMQNESNLP